MTHDPMTQGPLSDDPVPQGPMNPGPVNPGPMYQGPMSPDPVGEHELRKRAEKQLRAKRDLGAHVLAYVMVNAFLVIIWFMTSPGDFFWPAFPILGWGIGLAFNVWDVYSPKPSEEKIRREMDRLRGQ